MTSRFVRRAMIGFLFCIACVGVASVSAQEKVVFGGQPTLADMTIGVGIAKGFFREEGLEVSQILGQRSTDTLTALLAGDIQFGYSAVPPLVAASASGGDVIAVGLFSHGYSGILVASKANAHLRSLADFRGKRIGMQRGTGVATVFLVALDRLGLSERDFQISNLRVADMPTAMQGGSFDAVLGWEPNMSRIVALGYGEKVITPEQFEQLAGVTYSFPLWTTKDLVKRRPDLVQRFLNGFARAQHFAHTQRAESLRILRNTIGDATRHTPDAELEALAYVYRKDRVAFTEADLKDVEIMRDFMFKDGQIKTRPNLSELVDNSFALKAQQALKSGR